MSIIRQYFEHSLALPFFGIGMKTDLFQSCGHCWVFLICWHIECSTFTASSFRIWNSSNGIPLPPLVLFIVMLPKALLTLYSMMSGSRWVITPLWLSGSWRSSLYSSYEDLQDLLELTPPKICPFHYRGLECKSRKSRNTWSNRQIWPSSTEWSRAKANRVLPREHTGHGKHPLPTTQEKTLHMDITRWSTPKSDWLYSFQPKMEKLYTVSKNKTGSWLWLRSWTPYCQIQT